MARIAARILCLFAMTFALTALTFAQEVEVEGRVTEAESGLPLPGVNIAIQGTQTGTTTDLDGQYRITAPSPDAQLVFSFVGFQTQVIPIEGRGQINVALRQSISELEDVVVVGYGVQRKGDVTGSVSSIDVQAANVGQITAPEELMQGRVPGVNIVKNDGEPGAGMTVRIRGGTSITASNDPLYVIDGVPIDNASLQPGINTGVDATASGPRNPLGMLNANDIQSIDILKDASAAAIYGSRGANGVILITTKKGLPGQVTVDYDGYASTASMYRKLDLLTASQYRQFVQSNNLTNDLGSVSTDWQDAITQTAISHSHTLAMGGGTDNTTYRASVGYLDQEGIVLNTSMERLSGRINASHRAFDDNLRLSLNLTSAYVKDDKVPSDETNGFTGGLFTNVFKFNPTFGVRNADGSYVEYPTPSIRNPVAIAEQLEDDVKTTRTLGNLSADVDIGPGLTGRVNLGADRAAARRMIFIPRASPIGSPVGGVAGQGQLDRSSLLLETTLNYDNTFNDRHALTLLGGYSFQEFTVEEFTATMRNFVTDAWSFNNLSGGADPSIKPSSFREQSRLISFFGRANYGFQGKYLLTATVRRDGSTRFGAGHKWGLFPSFSAAWRISEESFLQGFQALSDLKLRAGYGVTGSQEIGNLRSLPTLAPDQGFIWVVGEDETEITGVAPNNFANENLKWEETRTFNAGVDYGFASGKFSGALEFYIKNTDDLLIEFDVPQPAVVSTRLENVGSVRNTGFEFSLNALAVDRRDLSVSLGAVFSTNKNEVIDLGGRDRIITGTVSGAGLSGVSAQIIQEGEPLGTFFGPVFLGIENGEQQFLLDESGNRVRQVLGSAQPDFSYGLNASVFYKDLDLGIFVRGEQGREVFNNTALEYTAKFLANTNVNFFQDAVNDGTDLENGIAVYSSRWVEDASFLRVDNVTLGYTFTNHLPAVAGSTVRRARIYLAAQNPLVLTSYDGYDPEVNTDAEQNGVPSLGIDYANYPRPRMFTVGLSLGF